ncbi:hypothetical protein [Streptomyces sp. NPDC004675]|uniref:hypothetical protein n=1 Tax=Streptomyces sp. NPDC004675 TaxID=3154286 RepID=UPI0033ACC098
MAAHRVQRAGELRQRGRRRVRVALQQCLQAAAGDVLDDRRVGREVRTGGVGEQQAGRADAHGRQALVRRAEQAEARGVREGVTGVGGLLVPVVLVR